MQTSTMIHMSFTGISSTLWSKAGGLISVELANESDTGRHIGFNHVNGQAVARPIVNVIGGREKSSGFHGNDVFTRT